MSNPSIDLVCGQQAHTLLADDQFLERWQILHNKCPHATAFQSPAFVKAWYGAYSDQWQPLVVWSQDSTGELIGLWLLAHDQKTNVLAHAGTHQAEYHTWLAVPGADVSFLSAAWAEVKRCVTFSSLQFKYLPAFELVDSLRFASGMGNCVVVRKHQRPLLRLDANEVKASFAKKSNKSRFNRIKKLGDIDFRRISDPVELQRVFDDLIVYYDFRQGAINHSTPFQEDSRKRVFHMELFATAPQETYVTATYLDERLISAFWGMLSGTMVHLGMLIHSPLLAEHSPGKLHIMQLSDSLLASGIGVIDLTPGGDLWKERFANSHDEVAEVVVYRFATRRALSNTFDVMSKWGKWCAARAGITPLKLRYMLRNLPRLRPTSLVRKIANWVGFVREFRVYRGDHALAERYRSDERVRCNSLSDLLAFKPGEPWQTRDKFLSSALARLEQKEMPFSVCVDDCLAHSGWMVVNQTESYMSEVKQTMTLPPGSVALYDFYSHPDFRGKGLYRATLGHMLHQAFAIKETQFAYISVLADNLPSRHVIETMGFEYQRSFFLKRRFGTEKKWAGSMRPEAETVSA